MCVCVCMYVCIYVSIIHTYIQCVHAHKTYHPLLDDSVPSQGNLNLPQLASKAVWRQTRSALEGCTEAGLIFSTSVEFMCQISIRNSALHLVKVFPYVSLATNSKTGYPALPSPSPPASTRNSLVTLPSIRVLVVLTSPGSTVTRSPQTGLYDKTAGQRLAGADGTQHDGVVVVSPTDVDSISSMGICLEICCLCMCVCMYV